MELLTFTIAAGELKRFERSGRYFEIIAADSTINVGFYDANGSQTDDAVNALSGLYLEAPFSAFEISSAAAQTVSVLITDGRGGSRRQPGIVSVVDGGKARTLAGQAFFGRLAISVGAGFLAGSQLINPVGSGRRLVVKKLTMNSDIANVLRVGRLPVANQLATAVDLRSKLVGPAAPVTGGQGRIEALAAIPGAFSEFFAYVVTASQLVTVGMEEPIVIVEGEGIALMPNVGAQTTTMIVEGFVE